MLTGVYYFRYVLYTVGDPNGDLSQAIALYNNISFDGKGNYTATTVSEANSSASQVETNITISGAYSISEAGFGFLTNPLCPGDLIWGGVSSSGAFIGSTTETKNGYNDLFVGVPIPAAASAQVTNATLNGTYSVVYLNYPDGYVTDTVAAGFQMNPNGAGSIGTLNIQAYQGANATVNVSEGGVSYSFSNGAATINFPSSGEAISGPKLLYISPDGGFVFGGAPTGFDFFFGVRTGSFASNFGGLYYQAGIDEDESTFAAKGYASMRTYYGSLNAISGTAYDYQRILAPLRPQIQATSSACRTNGLPCAAFSSIYADPYSIPFNSNGAYVDSATGRQYVVGAGGTVRIGFGVGPSLGISVALQAPPRSAGSFSPFLDPAGVVNAASNAPFTAGVSPGELINLYGSNLSSGTSSQQTLPILNSLNGIQVLINSIAAPIYYVSPNQISAIVPFEMTGPTAQIQVVNAKGMSNIVTELVQSTTPGVFTQSGTGLGDGAILHLDYSLVTQAKPAQPGEVVAVYTTGLGAVFPQPSDGSTSLTQLSQTPMQIISATVGGLPALVLFSGLAPGLPGVYQVNITVPGNAPAGDLPLSIYGPDSQASQATISIGAPAAAAARAWPISAREEMSQ